ncbi:MAG: phosphopantetheine-binding protein [Egibacteraceae bacterium]
MRGHGDLAKRISLLIRDLLTVDIPTPDTDLIDTGVLDSIAVVSLIVGLEEAYGHELPLDGFDVEYFRTPGRIADYLVSLGEINEAMPSEGRPRLRDVPS